MDRLLREETVGVGDAGSPRVVFKDKQYEVNTGRLWRESLPYYSGATAQWVSYAYDALGRTTLVTQVDNSKQQVVYSGLKVTTTHAKNQVTLQHSTPRGKTVKTTDALGGACHTSL